jgi:tetratricopeptide (TPR) repeat protein
MTETLFDRYKEALRAGHVAVLRGRLEDAAAAYRDATSIAADRAVPRTALGGVQLRLGDPAGALESFDGALALDPDDDASLGGRAQALVVLRRTADAARAYDLLADARAARGRLPDAAEAAPRALAIEPTDERRHRHADLVEQVRALDAPAVGDVALAAAAGAADGPGSDGMAGYPDAEMAVDADENADVDAAALTPEPPPEPTSDVPAEPPPDPEALIVAFEEAGARGDPESAAAAALAAARAYRAGGQVAAAFDACLQGIGVRPGDVELHLLLADLAVDHGWTGQAGDAYHQLLRIADLDGDVAAADLVRRTAAGRLPEDPRLGAG